MLQVTRTSYNQLECYISAYPTYPYNAKICGSKLNWIMHKRVLYWIVHSAKAICVLHWKTIFYNYFRILKSNPYFLTLLKYRKAKLHNSIKYLPGPSKAIYVAKWKSLHIPKLVEILLPMDHLVFRFATRGQCIKGKKARLFWTQPHILFKIAMC